MKWGAVILGLLLATVLGAQAQGETSALKVGDLVEDFALTNVHDEKRIALSDYQNAKALVILFLSTRCPTSNAYNERIAALHQEFRKRGVQFIGINSKVEEPFEEVRKHAREHGLEFPILKDVYYRIADRFGAQLTPEVYVLEVLAPRPKRAQASTNTKGFEDRLIGQDGEKTKTPAFKLIYHGGVDNSRDPAGVTEHTLRDVLNAFLAGEPLPKSESPVIGCCPIRSAKGSPWWR
ncbi:MAG: thioredoxin family protein [Candidatus Poribacteria bacterium]|nr:MAG: thioredoxin family protein [Candidatus Poribacteria bacterium]